MIIEIEFNSNQTNGALEFLQCSWLDVGLVVLGVTERVLKSSL
jgi:hypothetical protein